MLDRLNLTNSGQQGINGIDVTGFTLSNSTLSRLGNAPDEDGLHFHNLLGTNSISNTTITSSGDDNVNIQNLSATASTITITGGSFNTGVQGSGLLFGIRDTANTTITITGVTVDNNFSGGIVADGFDTATLQLDVTGSTITNNNDGIQVSANNGTSQFDIDNNDFIGNDFLAITLLKAAFSTGGTLEGAVRNNNPMTIANGRTTDAISIFQAGAGALKVAVTGNTINYAGTQRAILLQGGQDGSGSIGRHDYRQYDRHPARWSRQRGGWNPGADGHYGAWQYDVALRRYWRRRCPAKHVHALARRGHGRGGYSCAATERRNCATAGLRRRGNRHGGRCDLSQRPQHRGVGLDGDSRFDRIRWRCGLLATHCALTNDGRLQHCRVGHRAMERTTRQ